MGKTSHHVCPVQISVGLDNAIRRWLQNPGKILEPYIEKGMTVLDAGCGPGFFSKEMARLVGKSGRVIAADLQEGMLLKVKSKVYGTELEDRIVLHKCGEDRIGVSEFVDFVLVFYMLHEVASQEDFLGEIGSILKPGGQILIVEPLFHVSRSAFETMIAKAQNIGLKVVKKPKMGFSRAAVLKK
jgi:ubiquinone/menaquinone biosynthesis C-methylase UbiE